MQTDKKEIRGKNEKEKGKIYLCGWYAYILKKKKSKESTEKCINQKRIQGKVAEYKN